MPKEEGDGDEDEEIGPEESMAEKGAISVAPAGLNSRSKQMSTTKGRDA